MNIFKELNLKEHKKNKILVLIIILLIICILFLGGFIVYKELLNKENPSSGQNNNSNPSSEPTTSMTSTTTSTSTTTLAIKAEKISLPNLSEDATFFYNYKSLYEYYYTMDDVEKITTYKLDLPKDYNKEIKIENNKLMWKVDGNWTQDKTIKDDILYFYMENYDGYIYFIAITKTNKIYHIDITQDNENIGDSYNFNNKEFNSLKYTKVEANGTIEKAKVKGIPTGCEGITELYIQINNKVYLGLDLKSPQEYFKEKYSKISNFAYTCSYGVNPTYDINTDGTIDELTNEENKPIKVKYYMMTDLDMRNDTNNKNYYNFIIDENDYLYVIKSNDNKSKIKYKDKVTNFKLDTKDYDNSKIEITLQFNDKIILTIWR